MFLLYVLVYKNMILFALHKLKRRQSNKLNRKTKKKEIYKSATTITRQRQISHLEQNLSKAIKRVCVTPVNSFSEMDDPLNSVLRKKN